MTLYFSFSGYAQALAKVIQTSSSGKAFVVGITGPWGSGKTTLMETTATELGSQQFLLVRFNAWAHSKQDAIWRSLFASVVAALREDLDKRFPKQGEQKQREPKGVKLETALDDAERSLYTAFMREIPGEIQLDAGQLAKTGAKLALRFVPWGNIGELLGKLLFDPSSASKEKTKEGSGPELSAEDIDQLWGFFKRDVAKHHIAQVQSMEQFHSSIKQVLESVLEDKRRLLVLIDDVDRCLPEQGLEVFEAIKLYLDLPGSVFFIAMDQDVLQQALDIRYKQGMDNRRITAELYAEKMLDLTFTIPACEKDEFYHYVAQLPMSDVLERNDGLVSFALPRNPRTWERFANRIALHVKIMNQIAQQKQVAQLWDNANLEAAFVKLQLLNFQWPAVSRSLGSLEQLIILETPLQKGQVPC